MFNRHTILVLMLGGAVALPYLSSSPTGKRMMAGLGSHAGDSPTPHGHSALSTTGASEMHLAATPVSAAHSLPPAQFPLPPMSEDLRVEGNAPQTLNEVFRYDISPAWITSRWPRVSAGLSELDLQGYRVPLVTGVYEGDLAGSLTYYFNKKQQVDRIIFHGTTGDPRQLVGLTTERFELKRQTTDDPSLFLFQKKSFGKVQSELRIRPARVLRADAPHERFEVDLALKNK